MASELIITFTAALDNPFDGSFVIENKSNSNIASVGFSGGTAKYPIIWDRIGDVLDNDSDGSKPYFIRSKGEDTEVIDMAFAYFKPGTEIRFDRGDLDFVGDTQSGVPISAIEGTKVAVMTENWEYFLGEFKVKDGRMKAVVSLP